MYRNISCNYSANYIKCKRMYVIKLKSIKNKKLEPQAIILAYILLQEHFFYFSVCSPNEKKKFLKISYSVIQKNNYLFWPF